MTVTPLASLASADENVSFHKLPKKSADPNETENPLTCANEGCTRTFSTFEALSNHLMFDKCDLKFELKCSANSDVTKVLYMAKLSESSMKSLTLCQEAENSHESTTDPDINRGWALKEERRSKRFNENQRQFLEAKFNIGVRTGRKEDPAMVAEAMLLERNADGSRRFKYEEVLTVTQITSFFSRMCRKNKTQDATDDLEASREETISEIQKEMSQQPDQTDVDMMDMLC